MSNGPAAGMVMEALRGAQQAPQGGSAYSSQANVPFDQTNPAFRNSGAINQSTYAPPVLGQITPEMEPVGNVSLPGSAPPPAFQIPPNKVPGQATNPFPVMPGKGPQPQIPPNKVPGQAANPFANLPRYMGGVRGLL